MLLLIQYIKPLTEKSTVFSKFQRAAGGVRAVRKEYRNGLRRAYPNPVRAVGHDGSCTVIRQHIWWYVSKVTGR